MAPVHPSVMVAHGVEIVEEVRGSQLGPAASLRWAVVAVHHVRRHVQVHQGETYKRGQLVPPLAHLPEALQVEDEDVR